MTKRDFEIIKKDTKIIQITVSDQDNGVVNISTATIKFTVKETPEATTNKFQKTTSSGISITNGSSGIFEVTISPSDTANLSVGRYVYDCEITLSGAVYTILSGSFFIDSEIS